MKALYVLSHQAFDLIYPPVIQRQVEAVAEVVSPLQTPASLQADPAVLREVEAVYSGWGCVRFTEEILAQAPKLKIVFHGAGSVRGIVSDAFWERGMRITSAYGANAIPVAEYTFAQIIISLKQGWRHAREVRASRCYNRLPVAGCHGSTVGLVSMGMIGRLVAERLLALSVKVIAYDPFADAQLMREKYGVELVSLEELFRRSDVVSLHTPWLKETEGMITGELFASMKENATFINTARGAVVREEEMIRVLAQRPDLQALLDVTHPEPPPPESPLYDLPNVLLTPHIAGSMNGECARMGAFMVEETRRYLAGEPLAWEISRQMAAIMA